jgi:hypothetical protein
VRPVTVPDLRSMLVGLGTDEAGCRAGLRRDFRPEGPPQASDLGKLWISLDFGLECRGDISTTSDLQCCKMWLCS